jgi:hypothetical protein
MHMPRSLFHQQAVVAGHAFRHEGPQVAQADQLKELPVVQLPAATMSKLYEVIRLTEGQGQ